MSEVTTQTVVAKVVEAQALLVDFAVKAVERDAVARLDSTAANRSSSLSNEEMADRVAAAIAVLKGDARPSQKNGQRLTEMILRAQNRIQDNPAILTKLGFNGELPSIPAELLKECSRTSGTLVLKFKTTILAYQQNLNLALGVEKKRLGLTSIRERAQSLATTNDEPSWINVPNTVSLDTLGMSKAWALAHTPGSATCDPMDTVLMLGYHNLETGSQLPGFINRWTFTNHEDVLVGSDGHGIGVVFGEGCDIDGNRRVGLAPRLTNV